MTKQKKLSRKYFDNDVFLAAYLKANDKSTPEAEKRKLWNEVLYPKLLDISTFILNRYGNGYINKDPDVVTILAANIFSKLSKFDAEKSSSIFAWCYSCGFREMYAIIKGNTALTKGWTSGIWEPEEKKKIKEIAEEKILWNLLAQELYFDSSKCAIFCMRDLIELSKGLTSVPKPFLELTFSPWLRAIKIKSRHKKYEHLEVELPKNLSVLEKLYFRKALEELWDVYILEE